MKNWNHINLMNLFYIKYNLLPNLIAYSLAYSYHADIDLNCNLYEFYNSVSTLVNVSNVYLDDIYNIISKILITRYSLMITSKDPIKIIKIKNRLK